jgi:hypothetical protein
MTRDNIIRMAREAGFERLGTYASFGEDWVAFTESLEAFAHLVAEHEREECAKLCDDKAKETIIYHGQVWCDYFARAIRARGNT